MFHYIQRDDTSTTNTQAIVSSKDNISISSVPGYRNLNLFSSIEADKGMEQMQQFTAIVTTNRKLYSYVLTHALKVQTLQALQYRRVGTNS